MRVILEIKLPNHCFFFFFWKTYPLWVWAIIELALVPDKFLTDFNTYEILNSNFDYCRKEFKVSILIFIIVEKNSKFQQDYSKINAYKI